MAGQIFFPFHRQICSVPASRDQFALCIAGVTLICHMESHGKNKIHPDWVNWKSKSPSSINRLSSPQYNAIFTISPKFPTFFAASTHPLNRVVRPPRFKVKKSPTLPTPILISVNSSSHKLKKSWVSASLACFAEIITSFLRPGQSRVSLHIPLSPAYYTRLCLFIHI